MDFHDISHKEQSMVFWDMLLDTGIPTDARIFTEAFSHHRALLYVR